MKTIYKLAPLIFIVLVFIGLMILGISVRNIDDRIELENQCNKMCGRDLVLLCEEVNQYKVLVVAVCIKGDDMYEVKVKSKYAK